VVALLTTVSGTAQAAKDELTGSRDVLEIASSSPFFFFSNGV